MSDVCFSSDVRRDSGSEWPGEWPMDAKYEPGCELGIERERGECGSPGPGELPPEGEC